MRNYIITFDKENQQIGFNGDNIQPMPQVSVDTNELLGWILAGIIGGLTLLGFVTCFCLESAVDRFAHKRGINFPTFELSNEEALRAMLH